MRKKQLGSKQKLPSPRDFLWSENDPFSDKFKMPPGDTAKDILTYLIAEQQRFFGRTVLEQFNYYTMLRNVKLLLQEYSPDTVKRGIALSVRYAKHPASTKYIRECISWLSELNTQEHQK